MKLNTISPGALEALENVFHNLLPTFVIGSSELIDVLIQCADLLICQSYVQARCACMLSCRIQWVTSIHTYCHRGLGHQKWGICNLKTILGWLVANCIRSQRYYLWAKWARQRIPSFSVWLGRASLLFCYCSGVQENAFNCKQWRRSNMLEARGIHLYINLCPMPWQPAFVGWEPTFVDW